MDGDFVSAFGELARELNMAIGVTLLERYEGGPRNTLVLFDRFGERQLTYAKVHTCDFDVERHLTPGREFPVCVLDTAVGPVRVGAMICFDREFPESARILMLNGAELILVPNAARWRSTDCAVACARLREHDRDRDLQLSGFRAGMQWQLHRVRRRGVPARRPRRGRIPGYVPIAGRRLRGRVRRRA